MTNKTMTLTLDDTNVSIDVDITTLSCENAGDSFWAGNDWDTQTVSKFFITIGNNAPVEITGTAADVTAYLGTHGFLSKDGGSITTDYPQFKVYHTGDVHLKITRQASDTLSPDDEWYIYQYVGYNTNPAFEVLTGAQAGFQGCIAPTNSNDEVTSPIMCDGALPLISIDHWENTTDTTYFIQVDDEPVHSIAHGSHILVGEYLKTHPKLYVNNWNDSWEYPDILNNTSDPVRLKVWVNAPATWDVDQYVSEGDNQDINPAFRRIVNPLNPNNVIGFETCMYSPLPATISCGGATTSAQFTTEFDSSVSWWSIELDGVMYDASDYGPPIASYFPTEVTDLIDIATSGSTKTFTNKDATANHRIRLVPHDNPPDVYPEFNPSNPTIFIDDGAICFCLAQLGSDPVFKMSLRNFPTENGTRLTLGVIVRSGVATINWGGGIGSINVTGPGSNTTFNNPGAITTTTTTYQTAEGGEDDLFGANMPIEITIPAGAADRIITVSGDIQLLALRPSADYSTGSFPWGVPDAHVLNFGDFGHYQFINFESLKQLPALPPTVTSTRGMFQSTWAYDFVGFPDITGWDTTNVTDMGGMFGYCFDFNQDISGWNTGNVTNMEQMFYGQGNNSGDNSFNQNIGSWDVSNVTTMDHMFGYTKFNQDISSWDVHNVTNMEAMFYANHDFNQDLSPWCVENIPTLPFAFHEAEFVLRKPYWGVCPANPDPVCRFTLTNGWGGDYYNRSWFDAAIRLNSGVATINWGDGRITTTGNTTDDWSGEYDYGVGGDLNTNYPFLADGQTINVTIDGDIDYLELNFWEDTNVHITNFGSARHISFVNTEDNAIIGLPAYVPPTLKDMAFMFASIYNSNLPLIINDWDVSHVENMMGMFSYVYGGPPSYTFPAGLDLSNWDTSGVKDMTMMFYSSSILNMNLNDWDTSNVQSMLEMFNYTDYNAPLGNWDTGSCTQMTGMFWSDDAFNQDLSGWDVSNIIDQTTANDGTRLNGNWGDGYDPAHPTWGSDMLLENYPVWGTNPNGPPSHTHFNVIMSRPLIAYWRLNDMWRYQMDYSGPAHGYNKNELGISDLAIKGAPPIVTPNMYSVGVRDTVDTGAYSFNFAPLRAYDKPPLRLTSGTWGIEGWFKTSHADGPIIIKTINSNTNPSYAIRMEAGKVTAKISGTNSPTVDVSLTSVASLNDNNTHCFHLRMNGTRYDLFIDGILVAGVNSTVYPWDSMASSTSAPEAVPVTIGGLARYYDNTNGWQGAFSILPGNYSEFAIFSTALTDAEILENYTSGL